MRTARNTVSGAAPHAEGVAVHHALDVGVADDLALEVGLLRQLDQRLAHVFPRLTAVEAADDSATSSVA